MTRIAVLLVLFAVPAVAQDAATTVTVGQPYVVASTTDGANTHYFEVQIDGMRVGSHKGVEALVNGTIEFAGVLIPEGPHAIAICASNDKETVCSDPLTVVSVKPPTPTKPGQPKITIVLVGG